MQTRWPGLAIKEKMRDSKPDLHQVPPTRDDFGRMESGIEDQAQQRQRLRFLLGECAGSANQKKKEPDPAPCYTVFVWQRAVLRGTVLHRRAQCDDTLWWHRVVAPCGGTVLHSVVASFCTVRHELVAPIAEANAFNTANGLYELLVGAPNTTDCMYVCTLDCPYVGNGDKGLCLRLSGFSLCSGPCS